MKYEERLTQWAADGASLILDNPTTAEEARQQVMVQFKKACIKLAELEDKIERGELIERNEYLDRLMAAKDISGMSNKELEFFAKHNARVRENADAEISRLTAEVAELRARLNKAVELPVEPWDTIYCIRNCGTGRYRVEEHTVTEIVFEYNNQMRIKTSCGLFGCEKWTFGLDCFADNAEAEARLKELQGGER